MYVDAITRGYVEVVEENDDGEMFKIPEVEKAKYEWDGHSAADVLERLKAL